MENLISRKVATLAELEAINLEYGMLLYKRGYPILPNYCNDDGIKTIDFLELAFRDSNDSDEAVIKKVLKYISISERLKDINYYERFIVNGTKHKKLILLLGCEKTVNVLNIIYNKGISFHIFISNLPKINMKCNVEEFYNYIIRISKYNEIHFLEFLGYANFSKIRNAKNITAIQNHIQIIRAARNGVSMGKIFPSYSILNKIKSDRFVNFTKDPVKISTIGSETLCCFTKTGAARSLLTPAIKSPIAGILEGFINGIRWFSFVWEMVEFDEGEFKKCIILDNIEAKSFIKDGNILWARLKNIKGVHTVYCGTLRNDMKFEDGKDNHYKMRQSALVGYTSNFQDYGCYDDSREIYTLIENKTDTNAYIKRMDVGDLHRCKYLENTIYKYPDPEFIEIDVTKAPSYIIESHTNIYGYFVTRLKYIKSNDPNKYEQHADIPENELDNFLSKDSTEDDKKYEGIEKILYIEDIFMIPSLLCKSSLKFIFDDLEKWLNKNNIYTVVANPNKYSKPFIKRLKSKGITFIEQEEITEYLPNSINFLKFKKSFPTSINNYLLDDNVEPKENENEQNNNHL